MSVNFFSIGHSIRYTDNPPPLDGITALSLFLTFKTHATLNDGYMWSQWNYFDWGSSYTLKVVGNELLFAVHSMAEGYKMRITTNSPLLPAALHRICARWSPSGGMTIMVNKVACPVAVFGGYDAAVTALGPTVSEAPTLGLINLPAVGEEAAMGEYGEVSLWTSDVGLVAAEAMTNPVETLTTPKAPPTYSSGLGFYAPLCRSLYPDSAYPDPSISDVVRPCNSLLFSLDAAPAHDAVHPWVAYPSGSPYAGSFCPVVFTGATCSGGGVPSVIDPPGGVEFQGLGPHRDRMFIELDLD